MEREREREREREGEKERENYLSITKSRYTSFLNFSSQFLSFFNDFFLSFYRLTGSQNLHGEMEVSRKTKFCCFTSPL